MEKGQLISEVAKEAGIPEEKASKILDAFITTIKEGLNRGEKVTISGFGTFSLAKRKPMNFLNPKTNKIHEIPERLMPFFRPGRNFQNRVRK